jgi:protein TonB
MKLGTGVIKVDYGAFELKRSYQKHMTYAMLIGAGIHLFAMGAWAFVKWATTPDMPETTNVIRIRDISDLAPPPSIARKAPAVKIEAPKVAAPKIGIPEPVPDEEADENIVLATQDQLAEITQPVVGTGEGTGDAIEIDIDPDDFGFPAHDEFVAVEEWPTAIFLAQPDYPEMARQAGLTADVWVRVLVDKEGNVRDAIVEKASVEGIGFEEKAIEAAMKGKWTPAMQNNQPVACWASYQIKFTLEN